MVLMRSMIRIPVLDFIFRPGREEEEEELAARLSCCGGSDSASMSDLIVVDADDWTLPPPDFQHPLTSFAVGWGIKYQQNQNQQLQFAVGRDQKGALLHHHHRSR